jgi:uncharacterized membrane protein YdjX (TVP38/TMEM64 family)
MTTAVITTLGVSKAMSIWIKGGLGLFAIAAGWWALSCFDYERYLSLAVLTQQLNDAGSFAPLLLIGSMALAVVIPPIPSLPLDLAAGAAFGPFYGALYAIIGAEIGAMGCFLVARVLGREALSRLLKVETTFCQMCTDHQLMGLMFVARLIPIFSFDMVSYGAGLTNISLKTFAIATLVGMAPPTFALTYFGSSVVSTQWPMVVAGAAMVVLFLAMPKLLTKYRAGRVARLLLGPAPLPVVIDSDRKETPLQVRCTGCGGPSS